MKVKVPGHAAMRLVERCIDIDNAKRVIRLSPKEKNTFDDRIEATGTLDDGRILTIIYKTISKKEVIIITGYYEN